MKYLGKEITTKNPKKLKTSCVILISFFMISCSTPKIHNKISNPYDIHHPMDKDVPEYTETSLLFEF